MSDDIVVIEELHTGGENCPTCLGRCSLIFTTYDELKKLVRTDLCERLAAEAHAAWSGWMKYLFANCQDTKWLDGPQLAIPQDLEDRWRRQMSTPYADLPENEKESGRKEADRYLAILNPKR